MENIIGGVYRTVPYMLRCVGTSSKPLLLSFKTTADDHDTIENINIHNLGKFTVIKYVVPLNYI